MSDASCLPTLTPTLTLTLTLTHQAKHNASAVLDLCARCECALCMICAKPRNRWTSPLGQTLESVTTNTDPPFTFAYNPNDADMQRMREQLVLEPVLLPLPLPLSLTPNHSPLTTHHSSPSPSPQPQPQPYPNPYL